ncbi:MAG: hypothetical protein AAGM38_14010, partial [Pseudomonadota bacterium]
MAARWVGALLYAAAGAAAAIAVLAAEGPLDLRQIRETAPLAALLGGLLGLGVNERWPLRADAALATGFLTALVGLVFFCGLYLFGDAVIEAYLGGDPAKAVVDASQRLGQRLPLAAPMTIGAFMLRLRCAGGVWITFSLRARLATRFRGAEDAAPRGGDDPERQPGEHEGADRHRRGERQALPKPLRGVH